MLYSQIHKAAHPKIDTARAKMTPASCGISGIRRWKARRSTAAISSQRCCWKCRWCSDARRKARRLRCETLARIGAFRFPMEDLMEKRWSAAITAGSLMPAAGSAWRSRHYQAMTNCALTASLLGTIHAKSGTATSGFTWSRPVRERQRQFRQPRHCRSSATNSKSRESRARFHLTWTRASSD